MPARLWWNPVWTQHPWMYWEVSHKMSFLLFIFMLNCSVVLYWIIWGFRDNFCCISCDTFSKLKKSRSWIFETFCGWMFFSSLWVTDQSLLSLSPSLQLLSEQWDLHWWHQHLLLPLPSWFFWDILWVRAERVRLSSLQEWRHLHWWPGHVPLHLPCGIQWTKLSGKCVFGW